mmetsp:Transcript_60297/g.152652  ORF Transcript_60297/g.152652 Transcript_60297/m.152652 type:complete len:264 (+) Transcript_60297:524-1315(+)
MRCARRRRPTGSSRASKCAWTSSRLQTSKNSAKSTRPSPVLSACSKIVRKSESSYFSRVSFAFSIFLASSAVALIMWSTRIPTTRFMTPKVLVYKKTTKKATMYGCFSMMGLAIGAAQLSKVMTWNSVNMDFQIDPKYSWHSSQPWKVSSQAWPTTEVISKALMYKSTTTRITTQIRTGSASHMPLTSSHSSRKNVSTRRTRTTLSKRNILSIERMRRLSSPVASGPKAKFTSGKTTTSVSDNHTKAKSNLFAGSAMYTWNVL